VSPSLGDADDFSGLRKRNSTHSISSVYSGSITASDPGSWNRHAYVNGDPVNRTDSNGLCAVVAAGLTESSEDNSGESSFASAPESEGGLGGAMEAYGFLGGDHLTGAFGVAAYQFAEFTSGGQSKTLAAAITAAAADSGDPINLYLFSGSANAFKGAVPLLAPDVIARIQSITYASPGTVGDLITVNGIKPTVILGGGVFDVAATFGTTIPTGWLDNVIHTNCDHNAGCLFSYAPKQTTGNACNTPTAFSWDNISFFGYFGYPGAITPLTSLDFLHLIFQFSQKPIEAVDSVFRPAQGEGN